MITLSDSFEFVCFFCLYTALVFFFSRYTPFPLDLFELNLNFEAYFVIQLSVIIASYTLAAISMYSSLSSATFAIFRLSRASLIDSDKNSGFVAARTYSKHLLNYTYPKEKSWRRRRVLCIMREVLHNLCVLLNYWPQLLDRDL